MSATISCLLSVPEKPLSESKVVPISDLKDWQPTEGERTICFKLGLANAIP